MPIISVLKWIKELSSAARILLAFILGACCAGFKVLMTQQGTTWLAPVPVTLILPAALIVLMYPANSFRHAFQVGIAGAIGAVGSSTTLSKALLGSWTPYPIQWLPLELMFGLLIFTAICLVAVFLRRRFWPIFPAGCCKKCGYDLIGSTSGRCPECGEHYKLTFTNQIIRPEVDR